MVEAYIRPIVQFILVADSMLTLPFRTQLLCSKTVLTYYYISNSKFIMLIYLAARIPFKNSYGEKKIYLSRNLSLLIASIASLPFLRRL